MESYSRTRNYYTRSYRFGRLNSGSVTTIESVSRSYGASISGFKNPKWKEQVRNHEQAATPCTGSQVFYEPGYLEVSSRRHDYQFGKWNTTGLYQSWGTVCRASAVTALPVPLGGSSLDNVALSRFYKAAVDQMRRVDGLAFVGELRETVQQLKHPLRSLVGLLEKRELRIKRWLKRHGIRDYRLVTGRLKSATLRDFKNVIADTWLETKFGLQPLIQDVEDTCLYLQDRLEYPPGPRGITLKGKAVSKPVVSDAFENFDTITSNVGVTYNVRTTSKTSIRYKGYVQVSTAPTNQFGEVDFARLGFSVETFVSSLWELTPWSFLVDYFADIGGMIDSFSVPLNTVRWIVRTRRTETERVYSYSKSYYSPKVTDTASLYYYDPPMWNEVLPGSSKAVQFQRDIIEPAQLPRPELSLRLPAGLQFANIAALAASRSRSRFSNPH